MKQPYLEITYRNGRPFAGYVYLPRDADDRATRARQIGRVVVDFTASGKPIGIEIASIAPGISDDVHQAMLAIGAAALDKQQLLPLDAA